MAGDAGGALVQIKEALRIDPELAEARLLAADTSLLIPDYQQALQYAEEILARGPSPIARLIKVKALAGMGNIGLSTLEVNKLVHDFPNDAAPKLELAALKMAQKDFSQAESMYRTLYAANRQNLAALQGVASSLFAQNRYDGAIAMLKDELSKQNSPEIRSILADASLRGGKFGQAIEEYGILATASPESAFFHLKLGDSFLQDGKAGDAVTQFQMATRLAPKDKMANAMLALSLQQAGRGPEAIPVYRAAVLLDAENPVLMNNLAYLIAETGGDLDEALRFAQDASRRHPADSDLADTIGWIYLKKNKLDDALRMLNDIVRKNPAQPMYRYHLASALIVKGDKAGAVQQLEVASASKPTPLEAAKIKELLSASR